MNKTIIQIIILIVCTITVVIQPSYAEKLLNIIWHLYSYTENILTNIFAATYTGTVLRRSISILITPVYLVLIPSILYLLKNKRLFPGFACVFVIIWILTLATIVNHQQTIVI